MADRNLTWKALHRTDLPWWLQSASPRGPEGRRFQNYLRSTQMNKSQLAIVSLLASVALVPAICRAADGAEPAKTSPKTFVADSVITTKVKAKLASEHLSSLAQISVDTDAEGVVWLTGVAKDQAEIDRAVALTRQTEGVRSVVNQITVKKPD
jgi:hyperosmotically inducible protein